MMEPAKLSPITRRALLNDAARGAALAGVGMLGAPALGAPPATQPAKPLLPSGKLGKTGYPVTLISFGAILLQERVGTRVLKAAIDRGVNLVHTSDSYGRGKSIESVGTLFKANKTYRDKVFLCLKGRSKQKEADVDRMLDILGTNHAEVLLCELQKPEPKRLEYIQELQETLKKKGKVRYTGFVCHVDMNGTMEMVLEKAPDFFDVTLMAMTMAPIPGDTSKDRTGEQSERFVKNIKAFREKGIGILSMKSGARKAVTKGGGLFQAHAKAVLQAGADTVLTSMDTFEEVEMISKLDIKNPHLKDREAKAAAWLKQQRSDACLMCGQCDGVCPQGLPIADLMRCRLYEGEYGWHEHARDEYASLGVDFASAASNCGDCRACTAACPLGLASADTIRQVAGWFA